MSGVCSRHHDHDPDCKICRPTTIEEAVYYLDAAIRDRDRYTRALQPLDELIDGAYRARQLQRCFCCGGTTHDYGLLYALQAIRAILTPVPKDQP